MSDPIRARIRSALIATLNPTVPMEKFEAAVDAVMAEVHGRCEFVLGPSRCSAVRGHEGSHWLPDHDRWEKYSR